MLKKILKTVLWLVAFIVVLLVGAAIALQSPLVQTYAAKKLIAALEDSIDGTIHIEKVHFRPFNAIVIKNFEIIDDNPYTAEADTFARAGIITANFKLTSLLEGKGVQISKAYVKDGYMLLTIEPGSTDTTSTTNLGRIFRLPEEEEEEEEVSEEPSQTQYFEIANAVVENFRYKMLGFTMDSDYPEDAINWADLDICNINVKARKLGMKGIVMYGICDDLSFKEKSGFTMLHGSGDVRVGEGKTIIKDLRINDGLSDISLSEFRMTYSGIEAFENYIEEVRMDAEILPSRVDMHTIGYFAPSIMFMTANANLYGGGFHGTVDDFTLDKIRLKTIDSGFGATLTGRMTGVPDDMAIDARIYNSSFTFAQLGGFLSSISPVDIDFGSLGGGETYSLDATAKGSLDAFRVKASATPSSGKVTADMMIKNVLGDDPIVIEGQAAADRLNIGRLAGISALGEGSLRTNLTLRLPEAGMEMYLDSLHINKLTALGYPYSDISGNLSWTPGGLKADLFGDDPNLVFTADASSVGSHYKADIDVGFADLQLMGLDKRGTSMVSFEAIADFDLISGSDFSGDVRLDQVLLETADGLFNVGDILVKTRSKDSDNMLTVTAPFADISYSGSAYLGTFLDDIKGLTVDSKLPALTGKSMQEYSGNEYRLQGRLHDSRDLLAFVMPELFIADNTALDLDIDKGGNLGGRITSKRLAYSGKYLKNIDLKLDNSSSAINGNMDIEEISLGGLLLKANSLQAYAADNTFGLGYRYDNDTPLANKGEVFMTAKLERDENDSLLVHGSILPSGIYLNSDAWSIGSTAVEYGKGRIRVDSLRITNSEQFVLLDGGYSSTLADTLRLQLTSFDLGMLNNLTSSDLGIKGLATGDAFLTSPTSEKLGLLLNIAVDSTEVAGQKLGLLKAQSLWDQEQNGFSLSLYNELDGQRNIGAEGFYRPSDSGIQMMAYLDKFNAGVAQPFLESVFSQMEGTISGTVGIGGTLDRLDLSSWNLAIDDALLRVDYTNVPYRVKGPVHIDNQGVWFDNVSLSDDYEGRGMVRGSIGWDRLRDMSFDIRIPFREMEVLRVPEGTNDVFYGNAFGTGHIDITGPMSRIELDVDAATAKTGDFHIPLSGSDIAGTSNLLTFKEPEPDEEIDPYEEIQKMLAEEEESSVDLAIKLKVNVNRDTEAFIEVDKASGNILSGRGSGVIEVDVEPGKDIFTLGGNYNISSGKYHLDVLSLASKDFLINDGSSIKFNGDIMDSELNIDATYKLKASIGTLISDSTATARRTVECGLNITDRLSSPRIQFSINVPDLDPSTQVLVQEALSADDKVQKQFLSLLIAGSFLPDERSGIVDNSTLLSTTVSEIMSGRLNSIMQKLDLPLDIGLGLQSNSAGQTLYDVAVSTQLFNNRVVVNGNIGNRRYASGNVTSNEVVGDLDIEIKIDKSGALRVSLFSHSADQYSSFLDNSQRNGLGLTYQKEFDSFADLFRSMFMPKAAREQERIRQRQSMTGEDRQHIHIEKDE